MAEQVLTKLDGETIHVITSCNGTAGSVTSRNYNRTTWTGTISNVTALYDGLTIQYKIPIVGVSIGTTLNVSNLGEHPVVINTNTGISSRYPVGSQLILTYDSVQTASVYVNNVNTSFTGCWKITNYDSNTSYNGGTQALLEAGTDTTNRVWTPKILADYVTSKIPVDNNTTYKLTIGSTTYGDSTNGVNLGSLTRGTAANGGTTLSLVNTGDMYTWNNKVSKSSTAGLIKNDGTIDTNSYVASRGTPTNGGTILSLVNTGDMYTWNNKQDAITFNSTYNASTNKAATMTDVNTKATKANITAGTAGTNSATSGATLEVPYVTMSDEGVVTGYGTHTHTISGFVPSGAHLSSYNAVSANQSAVTTALTTDGVETKIYYNSGSSTITVSFATSGLIFTDGNDSMEIPASGYGEVNFLRITTSNTTRVFVRSAVSE